MATGREIPLQPAPAPGPEREAIPSPPAPRRRRTYLLAGGAVLAAAAAVVLVQRQLAHASAVPDGLIQVNGRIEGDPVTISGKLPGRIAVLAVREGDGVQAGQLLVQLDDATARARRDEARAAEEAAWARVAAATAELEVLRRSVPISTDAAQASLAAAESSHEKARASAEQAGREGERARHLREGGAMDPQTAERLEIAARVAGREEQRTRAEAARAARQLADARLGPSRIGAQEQQVRVLEAVARQARAQVAQAQVALDDLAIVSPTSGTVTTRYVEAGEVVAAGAPLLEVVDLDRLYLKCFVPEKDIGRVRLGIPARVFTDAFPDDPFPAEVRFIASRAEFTPKEVQTPDERARLVYAVKLYLVRNPRHELTPGLSADALIRWKEGVPWVKPRW
jgi:membrane fusion protein YbhG